jgi:hypothetical protein
MPLIDTRRQQRRLLAFGAAALASLALTPAAHAIEVQPVSLSGTSMPAAPTGYGMPATPSTRLAPQLAQLPQGTKLVELRCTPAATPQAPPDKNAARPPVTGDPPAPLEQQVGHFAPETEHAEVIDLGPCPPPVVHESDPEPEPEPRTTTPPPDKPDEESLEDQQARQREAMRNAQRIIDEHNRRQQQVVGGMR